MPIPSRTFWVIALLALLPAGCNTMFFQPDDRTYTLPHQFGLWHEEVTFTNGDGQRLSGWFIPPKGKSRGTVIHFHGNGANITNHLPGVQWLVRAGFAVFMFDYRGYGKSEGSPSRGGVIDDGVAALAYVRSREDVDPDRIVVFGQSLGGAVAISALARTGHQGVVALVVEGGFASYREVVRLILDDSWISWPFQYPVAYIFFGDALSPREDLPAIAGVPFLVIHGEDDGTVPIENGRHLYDAFPGQDKTFWSVPLGRHLGAFAETGSHWGPKLVQFIEARMPRQPPPKGYRYRSQ